MKALFARIKDSWYIPVILLLLAGLSYGISRFVFAGESLRLDEAQSIWQTSHSLKETLFIVAQDVHMPLYHILFHFWTIFFGTSTEAIRFMSFLFFVACLPFIYLLARTVVSRPWALFAATLFTLSPFANWYANEARMYTLLALTSIISQYFFVRIMKGQKNSWPWYTLAAIVGAYSHYFFMFGLLAQAIFYFFNVKRFPKRTFVKFIGVAVAVIIAISPWIIYFLMQGAASTTRPRIAEPTPIDFFNVYSQFIFGFQSIGINTMLVSAWPLMVVLALVTVRRFTNPTFPVSYILVAAIVPVLIAFTLSFIISPFFLSRYMIAAVAPICILIVWLLARYSKKVAITVSVLLVLLSSTLFIQQMRSQQTPVRENFQQVSDYITKEATPRDAIAMSSPFTVYPFEYYYKGTLQIRTLPPWDRQNPGPVSAFSLDTLPKQVDDLKKGHEYIYLILSYDQGYEEAIRTYFRDNYELVEQKTFSPKLTLLKFRVGYNDPVSFSK